MSHPFGRPPHVTHGMWLDHAPIRCCRVCGCSDLDAGWDEHGGGGRRWIAADLCSDCLGLENWPKWESAITAGCLLVLGLLLIALVVQGETGISSSPLLAAHGSLSDG